MSAKTIFIIAATVLVTVVLMQNQDEVLFKILWKEIYVSKLIMMLSLTFIGFLIGLIIGRPKNKATNKDVPLEINQTETTVENNYSTNQQTLSDEDRDYIS